MNVVDRARAILFRLRDDRKAQRQLATYATIGIITQIIDFGLFKGLLVFGAILEVATVLSIVAATTTHFMLNKYWSFKAHDRSIGEQLGTYLTLAFVSLTLQVAIVSFCDRILGMPALLAKFIGVVLNFPFGYVAHKYLTFGKGVRGTYLAWREQRRIRVTVVGSLPDDVVVEPVLQPGHSERK